jgi:tetratricopeptide (TPR) repeat protein
VITLAALTAAAYSPVVDAGFVFDDSDWLADNPLLQSADGLRRIWLEPSVSPQYYPLTLTSYWLEHQLWGLQPRGFHLVNVGLHLINAFLLWRVLLMLRLSGAVAWTAALLFALHPVNVMSVAWITERKNTLAMLFSLLALAAYFRFDGSSRWRDYAASFCLFLLALLSKTAIAGLPAVMLAGVWWRRGKIGWPALARLFPFVVIAMSLALVTLGMETKVIAGSEVRPEGWASRLAAAGWAVWFYLYKAVLPINLHLIYPRWDVDSAQLIVFLPLAALVVLFVAVARLPDPWRRAVWLLLASFLALLLPVLGIVDINFMQYSLVSDHWQYFALPCVMVAEAQLIGRACGRRPSVERWLVAGIAITFATLSYARTAVFQSQVTFWEDAVARNPGSAMAEYNLGNAYAGQTRFGAAMIHYQRAFQIDPRHMLAHLNLGNAYLGSGERDLAIEQFEAALRIDPGSAAAHSNLANALHAVGRREEALEHNQAAIDLAEQAVRAAEARSDTATADALRQVLTAYRANRAVIAALPAAGAGIR